MDDARDLWIGKQWKLTLDGMETLPVSDGQPDPSYDIPREDLGRGAHDVLTSWPVALAGRRWLDIDDFEDVYRRACHAFDTPVGNLDEMFKVAREIIAANAES